MGVIQRQGFRSSLIGFIGVGIGALSTLYVYPKALEILGLYRFLLDTSVLISIFVLLGSSVSAVRFFPRYRDSGSGHNGLLTWLLLVMLGGFILFLVSFPLIKPLIMRFMFHGINANYEEAVYYLLPLTFLIALINLLSRYISNFRRITVPAIFEQLIIKIALPIAVLLYLGGWINVTGVLWFIIGAFGISSVGMVMYLMYLGEWKLTRPAIAKDKKAIREYSNYSWYGLLSGIGSQVAFRIDTVMVASFIQFQASGIYTVAAALSEIIVKPMRSMNAIAGPMISHFLEENNIPEIRNIYRKSSLNMTIIGMGLFMLIWTVLPYILDMMPNSDLMRKGAYVVFFLGLAQVFDMMTGINNEIIYYSHHYRVNLYMTLFLAVINIVANIVLIPIFGLTGAAMATCTSIFLFNIARLVFIQLTFHIQPFSVRMIPSIVFAVAAWFVAKWIPETHHSFIDLCIKGTVFLILYGTAVLKFSISADLNAWVGMAWEKALFWKRKGSGS